MPLRFPADALRDFSAAVFPITNVMPTLILFRIQTGFKTPSHLWLGTKVSTVTLLRWVNFKFLIIILTEFGINTKWTGIRGKYQFSSHPLQSWPSFLGFFFFSWCTNVSKQVHKFVRSLSHTLSLRIRGTLPSLTSHVLCKIGYFSPLKKNYFSLFSFTLICFFLSVPWIILTTF